jgi:hypothetical protein
METVLVAQPPGRQVDWDQAKEVIQGPGSRTVAADPVAFIHARKINTEAVSASSLLSPAELAEVDQQVKRLLEPCERKETVEPLSGLRLGFLAVWTLAFHLVAFQKAVAAAAKVVASSTKVTLLGNSRPTPPHPLPSEFQELFEIVETWSRAEGIPCDRLPGREEHEIVAREERTPHRRLASVAELLLSMRRRRVLAVRVYGDLRPRLARLLPQTTVLPMILPDQPSTSDRDNANHLSSSWSTGLALDEAGSIPPAVQELRVERLRDALSQDLPLVLARARVAAESLRRFKPHVVLQMEDVSPWGRTLAALSRAKGAWTVVVQHGLTGEEVYGHHVMPVLAHCHACWGDYTRQWNIDRGAPPDSQIVVGNPVFDQYFSSIGETSGPTQVPNEVVFVSQPFAPVAAAESEFDRLKALEALVALERRGIRVIIRPHPSENREELENLVSGLGFLSVRWDELLETTLQRQAVVVARSSTVALEALIRGRPVVLVALSGRGDRTGLSRYGAALVAESQSELGTLVRACLEDRPVLSRLASARERLLPELLDGMDGRAGERLAQYVRAHLPE